MTHLEALHKLLDENDWDATNKDFNKTYIEVNDQLLVLGNEEELRKSEIERWAFLFNKNPERGITGITGGTKTLKNGKEIPYEWPDKNELTDKDFIHLNERFQNTKNLFAKTEFGLLLYYCGKLNNNNQLTYLLENLLKLGKFYYKKVSRINCNPRYFIYFKNLLGNSFKIAVTRKNHLPIKKILNKFILFNSHVHNTWNIKNIEYIRSIVDLTNFATKYHKEFAEVAVLVEYLHQNYKVSLKLSRVNPWGCIYVCDVSQRLANKIQNKQYDWQTLKADQYESMIQDAVDSGNLAAIKFVEEALTIYKKLNNKPKIQELEIKYDEIRRAFKMGEISQELPSEETKKLNDLILQEIESKTSHELILVLAMSPMFSSIDQIKEMNDEIRQENFLSNFIPSSIVDKFGNVVEVFASEDEKKQYNFWQTYGYNFQIGSQTLSSFFIESIKSKKINYSEIELFLRNTWIGGKYKTLYHGEEFELCPYDAIEPAIKQYFDQLELWRIDNSFMPNFICITDSLVTKTEYLLRFFCRLAGITTFTDKHKGPHKYKMEKNIDELLRSLKHTDENPTGFNENHRMFIQYILTQKVGLNMRHRVAHGLMDAFEYGFIDPLYILLIILKISGYTFNRR